MEKSNGKGGNNCGMCSMRTPLHAFLKVFLFLVILFGVWAIGFSCGMRVGNWRGGYNYTVRPMMRTNYQGEERSEKSLENSAKTLFGLGESKDEKNFGKTRLFGTVTKVEGNKITVLDNAAKEQVILSSANTIIMTSTTEIGLSAVKPGQNIVLVGSLNKDGALEAQSISIL